MRNYVKINIASPRKILTWTERLYIDEKGLELIGEVKNSMLIYCQNTVNYFN